MKTMEKSKSLEKVTIDENIRKIGNADERLLIFVLFFFYLLEERAIYMLYISNTVT